MVRAGLRHVIARPRLSAILSQPTAMTGAPELSQSSAERLSEIAEILAAGFMRLVARKSSPIFADTGDSLLDFSATESGHPTPVDRRILDG
jgi:hypothetical protein